MSRSWQMPHVAFGSRSERALHAFGMSHIISISPGLPPLICSLALAINAASARRIGASELLKTAEMSTF